MIVDLCPRECCTETRVMVIHGLCSGQSHRHGALAALVSIHLPVADAHPWEAQISDVIGHSAVPAGIVSEDNNNVGRGLSLGVPADFAIVRLSEPPSAACAPPDVQLHTCGAGTPPLQLNGAEEPLNSHPPPDTACARACGTPTAVYLAGRQKWPASA